MCEKFKTLILYVFHEINDNVDFFFKHALIDDPKYHYIIVINNPKLEFPYPIHIANYKVINRENVGYDFGGWSDALSNVDRTQYERFIFINSTVAGPFYPVWEIDWIHIFNKMIKGPVKLAGSTIGMFDNKFHVQSMTMVVDQIGLNVGYSHGIFGGPIPPRSELVAKNEIGFSQIILKSGYNIGCLMKVYQDIDFREFNLEKIDESTINWHCLGYEVEPYEVLFAKFTQANVKRLILYQNKLSYNLLPNKFTCMDGIVSTEPV
ncbi:hypothetical protein BH23THE1_BH23THE1_34460 [soil metagenome]